MQDRYLDLARDIKLQVESFCHSGRFIGPSCSIEV